MTMSESRTPPTGAIVRARAGETLSVVGGNDASMRSDWPQEDFLAWLDGLKAQLGLPSDYQLASHLGIPHTLISGWRSGRQRPSLETLIKIAPRVGEDPRRLWVLAGHVNAVDVGLLAEDAAPRIDLNLPDELVEAIALYRRPDLTKEDEARFKWGLRNFTQGFLAELASRQPSNHPRSGKRAG